MEEGRQETTAPRLLAAETVDVGHVGSVRRGLHCYCPPSLSVSTPTQAMGFSASAPAKAAPSRVRSLAHGCPEAGHRAAILIFSCDSGPRQMIVKWEASVYNPLP